MRAGHTCHNGGTLRFFDISGHLVQTMLLDSDTVTLSTASLKDGIYFISTNLDGKVYRSKLVVQH